MTAEDLARLPEDGWLYELIDGRLVRMSPPGGEHGDLAMDLGAALRVYTKDRGLGRTLGAETGFHVSPPGQTDTVLAPDVAFIRADRVPPRDSLEWRGFWRLAPDLVVEVASPSQSRRALADKARLWLAFGARLVWVVWPVRRQVDIWRAGQSEPVKTLGVGDTLDGEDVVPGFTYPVASMFS
jgi:Uma2 family endonuclease